MDSRVVLHSRTKQEEARECAGTKKITARIFIVVCTSFGSKLLISKRCLNNMGRRFSIVS